MGIQNGNKDLYEEYWCGKKNLNHMTSFPPWRPRKRMDYTNTQQPRHKHTTHKQVRLNLLRIEIQILDFWKKPRGREKERSQAGSWSSTESLGTEKRERRGKQERREKREKERQCLRLLKQTNRGLEKCDVFLKVSNIFIGLTVMFFYY